MSTHNRRRRVGKAQRAHAIHARRRRVGTAWRPLPTLRTVRIIDIFDADAIIGQIGGAESERAIASMLGHRRPPGGIA